MPKYVSSMGKCAACGKYFRWWHLVFFSPVNHKGGQYHQSCWDADPVLRELPVTREWF